ncbi:MAG: hypothetical protein ACOC3G_00520 [Phycisphaeraceae bacterium]
MTATIAVIRSFHVAAWSARREAVAPFSERLLTIANVSRKA